MRTLATALCTLALVLAQDPAGPVLAQTEEGAPDFEFFELMTDGKVGGDDVAAHCQGSPRAFSFETRNLTHTEPHQRVKFAGRQITNVNANPGEWNGSLYKPLCPGLYTFTVDFTSSNTDGATDGEILVHLHTWHKGGRNRPGELAAMAVKPAGQASGVGHASVVVEMATGDEFSLFTLSPGADKRHFDRIQVSGYRVHHLPDLARDFDNTVWDAERAEADAVPGAM